MRTTTLLVMCGLALAIIACHRANEPEPSSGGPQGSVSDNNALTGSPSNADPAALAEQHFNTLLQVEVAPDAKAEAMAALAGMRGDAKSGEAVFGRTCFTCHVVDDFGANLGPDLSDAGKRLTRLEIADSVINPNTKVDPKYYTVNIFISDGGAFAGFVESEDDASVTLRMGAELLQKIDKRTITKRETVKTSTMPDAVAATLSGQEFVDMIEYLAAQK